MSLHEVRAELFQTLSLQSRLLILDELRYGEACVCHLQHHLQKPQPYISQQLHVLKDKGIVTTQRKGVYIFYHLADPRAGVRMLRPLRRRLRRLGYRRIGDVVGVAHTPAQASR